MPASDRTGHPARRAATVLALTMMTTVACKRKSSTPEESRAARMVLDVRELPAIELGPRPLRADGTEDADGGGLAVHPTSDGGLAVMEPLSAWPAWMPGGFDLRGFDPAGDERWRMPVRADVDVGYADGLTLVVARETLWVAARAAGTVIVGGERIAVTPAEGDARALLLLRIDAATGRLLEHTSFTAKGGVHGAPMTASEGGVVVLLEAVDDGTAKPWLTPGSEVHLVRLDPTGVVAWTLPTYEGSAGAHLVTAGDRIVVAGTVLPRQVGGRPIEAAHRLGVWHAIITHDGNLLDVRAFDDPDLGRMSDVAMCAGRPCYLTYVPDSTLPEDRRTKLRPELTRPVVVVEEPGGLRRVDAPRPCDPLLPLLAGHLVWACPRAFQLAALDGSIVDQWPLELRHFVGVFERADSLLVIMEWEIEDPRRRLQRFSVTVRAQDAQAGSVDPS